MLKPFEPQKILVHSSHITSQEQAEYGVEKVTLEQAFSTSDIISLQISLNEKNYHLIDEKLLCSIAAPKHNQK